MKNFILFLFVLLFAFAGAQNDKSFKREIKKHRKEYKSSFLNEERSPLAKKDLKYLRFFDANINYRMVCLFSRTPDEKPFDLPTYSGITKPYVKYGVISFNVDGQKHQLAVYQSLRLVKIPNYRDHLFIPFKDDTNSEYTYGGGRYIDITMGDISEEGELILDFNKCYNPWCAYSDGFNCPIPPLENHLEISIPAGEKMFAKSKDESQ